MLKESTLNGKPWNASNLAEMFQEMALSFRGMTALVSHADKQGNRQSLTYDALIDKAIAVAYGLIDAGLNAGDRVMLLADNRLEWMLTSMSVTFAGGVDVPRGNDATNDEVNYILSHSASRFLVVEDRKNLERVLKILDEPDNLDKIIVMDGSDLTDEQLANPTVTTIEALVSKGNDLRSYGDNDVEDRVRSINPADPYTMIYTSGTTGRPKGVVITHANMMSQVLHVPIDFRAQQEVLAILPVWHSYERAIELILLARGLKMTYSSVRTLGADMKEIRPQIMVSAPRLWENVYSRIQHNVRSSSVVKRTLFNGAYFFAHLFFTSKFILKDLYLETRYIALPERVLRKLVALLSLVASFVPYFVLDKLVFKKLRDVVGGRFELTVSGGGALPLHIDRFFNYIGIQVLEGYGMTESSPVLSVRLEEKLVIGTVGPMWPETDLKIVDPETKKILYPSKELPHEGRGIKGEIHIKGPQVMAGYFRSPEETAKIVKDGWLNTGDLGMMTFNDCLKILGRSKDTIVLLSGENIEPVPIENRISQSPLVESCMVVGQDQKYLGLLVVPSTDGFSKIDPALTTIEAILESKEARNHMDSLVHESVSAKTGFKSFERIHSWRWVGKTFEVGDELTSTFKLKRHIITDKYESTIHSMYVSEAKKR